jgi:predicted transcriptional regulator
MVDRDLNNALQDVGYLHDIGMIYITEAEDKKTPTVDYDVPSLGGAPCRVAANVFL